MNYTVDYFIDKFESIPEEELCIDVLLEKNTHNRCAQGHCGLVKSKDLKSIMAVSKIENVPFYLREGWSLRKLFETNGLNVAEVNNGKNPKYNQTTVKGRVLTALRDIKKTQESEKPVKSVVNRVAYVKIDKDIPILSTNSN